MKKLFRNLMTTTPARRQGFWLAGQFRSEKHPMADEAIAAWSEFMGRDSAELWIAATALKDTPAAPRTHLTAG